MQAAALERVGHLACVVAGEHDRGMVARSQRAELGHRHLEIGQHLQQERLEFGVGLVDLIDEQHARMVVGDGAQQWPRQQETLTEEDVVLAPDALDGLAQGARLGHHLADLLLQDLRVEQLLGVLPLVEGLGLVQALVALQTQQRLPERAGQYLGELGLADAGGSFHQNRLPQMAGEVHDRRDRAAGDVSLRREALNHVVDRGKHGRIRGADANTRVLETQSKARRQRAYAMARPPSTWNTAPVVNDASAARNATHAATSSARPTRPSGVARTTRAVSSAVMSSGSITGPGATAFTRTCGASSRASALVSPMRPA